MTSRGPLLGPIALLLVCTLLGTVPARSDSSAGSDSSSSGLGSSSGGGGGSSLLNNPSAPISPPRDPNARCEEIKLSMCRGIGYNLTSFPNEMNHDTQEEAGLEANQFFPLVEMKCSADLKFFLCSLYMPICIEDYHKPLPVCRSVCERARSGCAPIMQQYSFQWPEKMSCERFPVSGDPHNLCMEPETQKGHDMEMGGGMGGEHMGTGSGSSGGGGSGSSSSSGGSKKPTSTSSGGGGKNAADKSCKPGGKHSKNCQTTLATAGGNTAMGPDGKSRDCGCRCKAPLVALVAVRESTHHQVWHNSSSSSGGGSNTVARVANVPNCGIPCHGMFFTADEKEFAGVWISLWSGLCFVSTLMTLTTFVIDTERFKYPERPIVFLSLCYFMVACGYLSKLLLGHEAIACDGLAVKYSATGPGYCTLVFLLVYYFGMASSVWWVVLAFTWFLAAGLKWGNESIAKHSQYFHLAAWLIPTVQSVSVLLMHAVDGDPVAGICYVGNMNQEHLKRFVLAPLFVYLVVGTTFLLAGFVSLFRIRSVIKQQGGIGAVAKADKLEKLMIRIGVFSVLYTVPATVVIACSLYEAAFFEDWMAGVACPCRVAIGARQRPQFWVLMLKYFMALAVGITSGVWIWSGKTVDSWRRLWRRLFGAPDRTGANQALIKQQQRGTPAMPGYPYAGSGLGAASAAGMIGCGGGGGAGSTAASLMATPYNQTVGGSVASTSHHHLHHHVLKQPPMQHV